MGAQVLSVDVPPQVSINILDADHYYPLARAIRNVLSTGDAEYTFAELLDGIPLAQAAAAMDSVFMIEEYHPLWVSKHSELCGDVLDRAKKFCRSFDPGKLYFNAPVIKCYQKTVIGSREFKMRLVELVTATIHHIAVKLFRSEGKGHSKDEINAILHWNWESATERYQSGLHHTLDFDPTVRRGPHRKPREALFYHRDYMDHAHYPHGLADVAAFYAENRIFGGAILFDRGDSGFECKKIYLNPAQLFSPAADRYVSKLQDSQFDDMIRFLLSKKLAKDSSPFPMEADDRPIDGFLAWYPNDYQHIFREPWARLTPLTKEEMAVPSTLGTPVHGLDPDPQPAEDGHSGNKRIDRFNEAYNS